MCVNQGAFACLLWQWATATILSLSSLLVGASRLQAAAEVPEYTLYALPLLTLLAVMATTFFLADASSRIPPAALSIPNPLPSRMNSYSSTRTYMVVETLPDGCIASA